MIPLIVILKALGSFSDRQIYSMLMRGNFSDSARSDKVEVLLKTGKLMGYASQESCLSYIGSNFRYLLNIGLAYSDQQAGQIFLN